MWIVLFEVGEEVGVRQVKEARCIIGHNVGLPWDEEPPRAVPVESLVGAGFIAQESGGTRLRHGAFVLSAERWGVIRSVFNGAVREVVVSGHDAELALTGCLLEIAVGDRSGRVVSRDEGAADVFRQGITPHARLECFIHEDSSKA